VLETREQFVQRHLYQLGEQFRQQGLRPTKRQLLIHINDCTLQGSPVLQQTVSDILDSLADLPSNFEATWQEWWQQVDAQLAPLIEPAARHLKAQTDPFVRASTSAIARYLGQYSRILPNLEKLPETAEMLAQVVETSEEFALRRLQWWGAYYQAQKICPQRSDFLRKASLKGMAKRPHIQTAVSEMLHILASFPSKGELEQPRH
jgi:hypothetical protein